MIRVVGLARRSDGASGLMAAQISSRRPIPTRSKAEVSEIMRRVRSADTTPEREFGRALRRSGLRFRMQATGLPGKPDLVFRKGQLAVFVDGDFWHGHQWLLRGHCSLDAQLASVSNREYWSSKITRNVMRDFQTTASLLNSGWSVLRLWESSIKENVARCVEMTVHAITAGGNSPETPEAAYEELPRLTVAEFFAGIGLVRVAFSI
jgi:DNA mismatch endonuclease, patch repair protein